MSGPRPARMLATAAGVARPALAGLSATAQRCGELLCAAHEYCSRHLLRCRPCAEICTPESRNFQRSACDLQCQDFLHDMQYVRKSEQQQTLEALARLEADLQRLTVLVAVAFCLLLVAFLWLAFNVCSRRWRRRKTHHLETDSIQLKSVAGKTPNGSAAAQPPQVIRDKASTVPQYTLGRHNSYLMATKNGEEVKAARGRHPAEDTCPAEYSAAYDNPALAVTPPLGEEGATSHPLAGAVAAAAAAEPTPGRAPACDPRTSHRRRTGDVGSRDLTAGSGSRSRDLRGNDGGGVSERERHPLDIDITDLPPPRTAHAV